VVVGGQGSAPEARFAGTSADGSPRTVAFYGGAVETDRVKARFEWLEFYGWGVRLRGRGLLARLLAVRDVRYEEIADLALLIASRGHRWRGPRCRGVRVRTAGGFLYFFAKRTVIPLIVRQFEGHGIFVQGQVTRTRLPYANSFIYPNGVLEPLEAEGA
jgi:hypothetical protein